MAALEQTNGRSPGRRAILWMLSLVPWLPINATKAADPSALWNIDNGKCVPHMRESNDPAPCAVVDLRVGFVVLKDLVGATQFLLLPTVRISGIEDPAGTRPERAELLGLGLAHAATDRKPRRKGTAA